MPIKRLSDVPPLLPGQSRVDRQKAVLAARRKALAGREEASKTQQPANSALLAAQVPVKRQPGSSRVHVVFRGGVGDWFVWLTKIVPILRLHERDEVHLSIASGWSEAIALWAGKLKDSPLFKEIHCLSPYSRPVAHEHMESLLVGFDLVYHCDVWKGARGAPTKNYSLIRTEDMFGHIQPDWYPTLDIDGDGIGGTVIQTEGVSVGSICSPEWWKSQVAALPGPVRLLGSNKLPPSAFGATAQLTGPEEIYAAIKSAELMVGIDSGFRNIAMTLQVPVIEVREPTSKGYPAYDVFVPEIYRGRVVFLDVIPPGISSALDKLNSQIKELSDKADG